MGLGWSVMLAGALLLAAGARPALAAAQEPLPASVRLDDLLASYRPGGSLGFALRDTALDEQLYRQAEGSGHGVVWSARFQSRWALTVDQLDRWSAQAIGLLVDALDADVTLGGWERLAVDGLGDQHLAYRYALLDAAGASAEATIVVFTRGEWVGLSGSAALGDAPALGGVPLARLMDGGPRG